MGLQIELATTPWLWNTDGAAETLCRQAERVEAMGFHSLWLPENHFSGSGAIPAPLMLLAAVAARTSTLRLGCTSYLLPIRDPLLAAEEVAVLDQLCAGRLILGLGRGIQPVMFEAFGIDPSDKRRLFREKLDTMRRAWHGEPVVVNGDGREFHLSPLPVQRPEPDLWVAAFGPKALKQVAGLGLPYLASPMETLIALEDNYARYREHLAEAGHPPVETTPVMRSVFVCQDGARADEVRAAILRTLPPALRDSAPPVDEWALVGDKDSVARKLGDYRERLGLSHLIVRAGIPGVEEGEQLASFEALAEIVAGN